MGSVDGGGVNDLRKAERGGKCLEDRGVTFRASARRGLMQMRVEARLYIYLGETCNGQTLLSLNTSKMNICVCVVTTCRQKMALQSKQI